MSLLQVSEVELVGETPALQVAGISLVAAPPPAAGNQLRIAKVELVAAAEPGTGPSLEAGQILPWASALAGDQVTMSVVVGPGATSITWTPTAESLEVALAGTDTEKSFTAPYTAAGGVVEYTVVAHNTEGDSFPVTMLVEVLPHASWHLRGGQWVPTLADDPQGD